MHFLYNHIRIIVSYNETMWQTSRSASSRTRIIGFVEPFSTPRMTAGRHRAAPACPATAAVNDPSNYQSVDSATEVVFTYDIAWEESSVLWSNRWDVYLKGNPDDKIHWFSITNSTMIVIFLTAMVGMILVRTLNRDIAQYNDVPMGEDVQESGWKLVHGVFGRRAVAVLFRGARRLGVQLDDGVRGALVALLLLSPATAARSSFSSCSSSSWARSRATREPACKMFRGAVEALRA